MKPFPSTSIIISVYKNVRDLAVVLRSLEQQSVTNFHTIISEDGESEIMKQFISSYGGPLTIEHYTQKDEGWKKNQALNQAIRRSRSDYLVFIDGDCVLHPDFMKMHLSFANPKHILAGRRVKLGPSFSDRLRQTKNLVGFSKNYLKRLPAIAAEKGSSFADEGIFSPSLAKLRTASTLKGCNMSFYRSAIETINGFDENYTRPAVGEDTDLDWRFIGMGYKIKSLRHLAIQYHLYHKENWVNAVENIDYMNQKIANKEYIAKNGLK